MKRKRESCGFASNRERKKKGEREREMGFTCLRMFSDFNSSKRAEAMDEESRKLVKQLQGKRREKAGLGF